MRILFEFSLDKLNQFIADTNISERVRNQFKVAKNGYQYVSEGKIWHLFRISVNIFL